MLSAGLANGADPGSMAPPTARLSSRLVAKDAWPQGPDGGREQSQSQDQSWNSNRDRVPDGWAPERDRPQEQVWSSGRDRAGHSSQDQTWMSGRERPQSGADQGWETGRGRAPEQGWAGSSGPEQGWSTGRGQDQGWSGTSRDRGLVWRPGT